MHRQQTGFTLIEILVTVFVIGLGLLAVAGLQIIGKKTAFDAAQRTLAAQATQDILARMRANAGAVSSYLTANAVALNAPAVNCASSACTPAQLAAWDLHRWGRQLAEGSERDDLGIATGGLVQPTACILAGTAPGQVRIAIAWRGITPLRASPNPSDPADPANVPCGVDAYLDANGVDDFRRVVVLDAFVASPT